MILVASLLATSALVADASVTLTRRPAVGLADNGDFWRVMHPAGIDHIEELGDDHHAYVRRTFTTVPRDFWSNPSSPALVASVARAIGWGFRDRAGTVDIRQVGFLYLLLSIALLAAALALRVHPLVCLGCSWVLFDPGYCLFYNSFYSEPPALLAVLAIALWFASADADAANRPRAPRAVVLWTLILVGATARAPMVFLGFTVVAVLGCGWARARPRSRPALLVMAVTLVVALAPVAHFLWGPAIRFPVINNFNAVFRGIAQFSARPERALESLEIPTHYRDLVGGHFREVPEELEEHLRDLSRWELVGLYLTDPGATLRALGHAGKCIANGRRNGLGNRERVESPSGPRQFNRPWQFDRIRRFIFAWPWWVWMFVAIMATRSLAHLFRGEWHDRTSPLVLFLTLTVVTQVGIAIIGDGGFSLTRHLTTARLAFDLLLVVAAAQIVSVGVPRLRARLRPLDTR